MRDFVADGTRAPLEVLGHHSPLHVRPPRVVGHGARRAPVRGLHYFLHRRTLLGEGAGQSDSGAVAGDRPPPTPTALASRWMRRLMA